MKYALVFTSLLLSNALAFGGDCKIEIPELKLQFVDSDTKQVIEQPMKMMELEIVSGSLIRDIPAWVQRLTGMKTQWLERTTLKPEITYNPESRIYTLSKTEMSAKKCSRAEFMALNFGYTFDFKPEEGQFFDENVQFKNGWVNSIHDELGNSNVAVALHSQIVKYGVDQTKRLLVRKLNKYEGEIDVSADSVSTTDQSFIVNSTNSVGKKVWLLFFLDDKNDNTKFLPLLKAIAEARINGKQSLKVSLWGHCWGKESGVCRARFLESFNVFSTENKE